MSALPTPGADRPAVTGIDLDIPAGSTLAVVGETGSGRTTLGSLLARLYDASSGTVFSLTVLLSGTCAWPTWPPSSAWPARAATPNWPPRPSMRRRSLGWLSMAREQVARASC